MATARLSVLGNEVAAVIVHIVQAGHPGGGMVRVVGVDGSLQNGECATLSRKCLEPSCLP